MEEKELAIQFMRDLDFLFLIYVVSILAVPLAWFISDFWGKRRKS